jgi:hypothetical protein
MIEEQHKIKYCRRMKPYSVVYSRSYSLITFNYDYIQNSKTSLELFFGY